LTKAWKWSFRQVLALGVIFKAILPTIWTVLVILTDLAHFTVLTPLEAFGSRFDPF